jgi:hypothetical protein
VVDDAHWADDPSLRWLIYLSGRVSEEPTTRSSTTVLALHLLSASVRASAQHVCGLPSQTTLVTEERPRILGEVSISGHGTRR